MIAVKERYDAAKLDAWIADPNAVKPGTKMPKLPLSDDDREAIVTFLLNR